MSEKIFFAALLVVIIIYAVCLCYIAGEMHEQCGGIDACLEEAFGDE